MLRNRGVISVIVPVYNVEIYLEDCVKSVIAQTYKQLEIILVDDGATDASGSMCDAFARMDERIKVIHQANAGLSAARNTGLQVAKGEYIAFVDSDDWIEEDALETLYEACIRHDVKMACAGRYDAVSREKQYEGMCPEKDEVVSAETMLSYMFFSKGTTFSVCDKLFHYTCFEEVEFPVGKIYEDIPFTFTCVKKSNAIALCAKRVYNYRHRPQSITTTRKMKDRLLDYTNFTKKVLEDTKKEYPSLVEAATLFRTQSLSFLMSNICSADTDTFRKYKKIYRAFRTELQANKSCWLKSPHLSRKQRRVLLLHYFGIYRKVNAVMISRRKRHV